jgi:hypothetical protein
MNIGFIDTLSDIVFSDQCLVVSGQYSVFSNQCLVVSGQYSVISNQ